jgi:DNA-binding MarR family transcriptional regulator
MKVDEMLEWVRRYEHANFIVEKRKQAIIRDLLGDDLTPEQLVTLQYIRKNGTCTSTALAEAFCVGKSAVTAIINRLVEKRYIARTAEASDRRVIALTLTEEGKRVQERFERKIHELLASLLECFAPGEVESFLSTYEKLASAIQKVGRREKER